jgi:hypothetical protein
MARKDKDLPLVSHRSPSAARARRADREPAPADAVVVGRLLDVLELELAYTHITESAVAEASSDLAEPLREAAARSRARSQVVSRMISGLGGSPMEADEVQLDVLPWRAADLAGAAGPDALHALLAQQDVHILRGYTDAVRAPGLPEPLAAELEALIASVERGPSV